MSAYPTASDMTKYWDENFAKLTEDPDAFYDLKKLPEITQASHFRRIELLNSLPLGDLSDKVCVDYGVGPWGFGCVFHKLKNCGFAIGIDISAEAVRQSEKLALQEQLSNGNYKFLTSNGNEIDLPDSSVDVFFAGEAIEHVDHVQCFLDEVHRVLKPDGLAVLTTPNADAHLYRLHHDRYTFNAEHVSLMNYDQLRSYLQPGFELLLSKGFNGSFYLGYDYSITNPDLIHDWARAFEHYPELATGVIVMARKKNEYQPARYTHTYYHHASPKIQYKGTWEICPLHGPMTGVRGHPEQSSELALEFEGNGLIINFWGHDWSGFAQIELDGEPTTVDLFSHYGGCHNIHFANLNPGPHRLIISPRPEKNALSVDQQTIFWRAISYETNRQKSGGVALSTGSAEILKTTPPDQTQLMFQQELVSMAAQLGALQEQLRLTKTKLAQIETTRTWRWASSIAYSAPGRALSRLLKPLLR